MDDAWLIDTGDWRQPSIVVLESKQPHRLNEVFCPPPPPPPPPNCNPAPSQVLNTYLSFLKDVIGDDQEATAQSFSEIFSGWLEEKGIISYSRYQLHVTCDV